MEQKQEKVRATIKPNLDPDPTLVYVSEARFREALHKRGMYDLDQVARDIKLYPPTLRFRLRVGSFQKYIADRLEKVLRISPSEYVPLQITMLSDEDVKRIADEIKRQVKREEWMLDGR